MEGDESEGRGKRFLGPSPFASGNVGAHRRAPSGGAYAIRPYNGG